MNNDSEEGKECPGWGAGPGRGAVLATCLPGRPDMIPGWHLYTSLICKNWAGSYFCSGISEQNNPREGVPVVTVLC